MTQRTQFRAAFLAAAMAVLAIVLLPACSAQTATHKKKTPPKPEPTAPELFEYIRGALLSLSPEDGINDNVDVTYDLATGVLTVKQPGGHCDEVFGALDANDVVWDDFDPSDSRNTRERLVRVTMVSVSGKTARTCYDKANQVDPTAPTNRVRLLFSRQSGSAARIPELDDQGHQEADRSQGGAPEQDLF